MFHGIGRLSARYAWLICVGWLLCGVALHQIAPRWESRLEDDDVRFVPDRFTSVRAYHLQSQAFPNDLAACKAVFALERRDRSLSDADFHLVDAIVRELDALRREDDSLKIGKVESYKDGIVGSRLTSADRQCTLVALNLHLPYQAIGTHTAVERAEARVKQVLGQTTDPPDLYTTGLGGIGRDLITAAAHILDGTTWATVGLVIAVLLIVYRAPLLALIPLVTIGVSAWVSLQLLALMTTLPGVHLVSITKVFAIVILFGAGTDYCLFLVSRYREELEKGHSCTDALAHSVGGVGWALVASAGTVMVGLGLMAIAEFAKVRYAGPAIALCLFIALIASLTLTPALLSLFGAAAFWPKQPPRPRSPILAFTPPCPTFWERVSHGVARRPAVTWCLSLAILCPFVLLGFSLKPTFKATGELSPRSASLQGLDALQRHFTAGEVGPITVLLASAAPWDSTAGQADIQILSNGFARLPNVAEVRSLTQPLGWAPPDLSTLTEGDGLVNHIAALLAPMFDEFREAMQQKAREHYLAQITEHGKPRHVTRLDIVLDSDPFGPAGAETLQLIQTWLNSELPRSSLTKLPIQAECCGVTANAMDLASLTEGDRHRVNLFVLGAIFLILVGLVRRTWLAAYLLVTVMISYYAALGATALMGYFWTGQVLTAVEWRVPFFLFTILVAVGEDYNILLLHRAMQERRRHGDYEGMRLALSCTGGAITSCGLIMAGTFATLMLAGLNTLSQIGFALAFGVLVDTFVVRPFLVPAFCMMLWRMQENEVVEDSVPEKVDADALVRILGPAWANKAA